MRQIVSLGILAIYLSYSVSHLSIEMPYGPSLSRQLYELCEIMTTERKIVNRSNNILVYSDKYKVPL